MEPTIYTVDGKEFELQHYGVKGMKWGRRKAQNTQKWSNQRARKEYDKLDRSKTAYNQAQKDFSEAKNKAFKRSAGALSPFKKHRWKAEERKQDAIDKGRKLKETKKTYKDQKKAVRKNTTVGQKLERGAKKIPGILTTVGTAYVADQMLYGGRGTKAVKGAITVVGMAGITAYTAARGGTDIHWYDKQGRKII